MTRLTWYPLLTVGTLLVCCALPVAAQERRPPVEAAPIDAAATGASDADLPTRLTLQAGYGFAARLNGSTEVDIASVLFRWSRPFPGGRVLGGEPAWGFEVAAFRFAQDPRALGLGGHVLYEHRFAPDAAWHPLVRIGVGALGSNARVPPGETFHNFSMFAEMAIEWSVGSGAWIQTGYRLHHVSNADTGTRNLGINAHTLTAAITWSPGARSRR